MGGVAARVRWIRPAAFAVVLLGASTAGAEVSVDQAAAGGSFSLARDSKGGVWAWGGNGGGQLGDGTRTDRTTPLRVEIPTLGNGRAVRVTAVSANGQSLALLDDATVRAWGGNGAGQLGDGTQVDRLSPIQVRDTTDPSGFLRDVSAVSAGAGYSLAIKRGKVLAWGGNNEGQLGSGAIGTLPRLFPGLVVDPTDPSGTLTHVVAIAAGSNNTSVVIKDNATVWAWGRNNIGQIGNGTSGAPVTAPVQVTEASGQPLTGVVAIAQGVAHGLALKADGTVWAWGFNQNGQLGDGSTINRTRAVPVPGLTGIVGISAGNQLSLAVRADGTAWAWGRNASGQLGDGTTQNRLTPVQVVDPSHPFGFLRGVVSVAAGGSHSLAVTEDGSVHAWGSKGVGQLGDGTAAFSLLPGEVHAAYGASGSLVGVGRVYAVGAISMVITSGRTVFAWGANGFGNLGDGTTADRLTPVQVIDPLDPSTFLTDVASLSATGTHGIAARGDRTVRAWGINSEGQLGNGGPVSTTLDFVKVIDPSDSTTFLTDVTRVGAGGQFSLAVKAAGTAWAWGPNTDGQLGINNPLIVRSLVPVQVTDGFDSSGYLQNVTVIVAGGTYAIALKGDGSVWGWGQNTLGQLGDGTNTPRRAPVQVVGLSGIVEIATGNGFSLARKGDGTVWAWGFNATGQLGDGSTTNRNVAVQVLGLTGATAIAAGGSHALALLSDEKVRSWGLNGSGQLGDGTQTLRLTPVLVAGLAGVTGIAAGGAHSLALMSDTSVQSWGFNGNGQLGNDVNPNTVTPVKVSFPKG